MTSVMLLNLTGNAQKRLMALLGTMSDAFRLIGEAEDMEQVPALLRQMSPEILVCCLSSPEKTMHEGFLQLHREAPDTELILICMEESFVCARLAVTLGAADCLLFRELSVPALKAALERAEGRLSDRKRIHFLEANAAVKAFWRKQPQAVLPDWIRFPQLLILCAPAVQQTSLMYMDSFPYWRKLNEQLQDYGSITSVVFSDMESLLLLPTGKLHSKQRLRERGLAFAMDFQKFHKETYQFDLHIALGGVCLVAAQLYDGYLKTRALLMDGVFNQNAAIMENQPEAVDEVLASQVRSCLQSMQELISERRYNEAKVPAATMMDQLRKSRFPPLFQEVMIATEQLLGEHAKRGGLVYPYSSISQAKKALLATLSVLEAEQSAKYSWRVRQMLQHIHQHYQTGIDLNGLAAELGITPIYAGQLFKKETGQTFSSYLTRCRLAKAQRLLETGKYKISEVSELVGYQSISYFSRTFKRVTGRTPYSVLSSAHAKQRP